MMSAARTAPANPPSACGPASPASPSPEEEAGRTSSLPGSL